MIVARLDGGLGNQLFQYACGLYQSERFETELVLDLSSYAARPQHGYLLDKLQITASEADADIAQRFPRRYLNKTIRWHTWPDWLRPHSLHRLRERPFGIDPTRLNWSDNAYLHGYWQSEQFFPGLRPALIEQFQPRGPLSFQSQRVAERLRKSTSFAVHVRRGDYVTDSKSQEIYVSLGLDYYRRCIRDFAERHDRVELFVFSNDPIWCRQHFSDQAWPTHIVDHNSSVSAHEDLWLMGQAAGCVIANSTFSWWAAYLNERASEHQIYVPPDWFQPNTLDASRIVPQRWRREPIVEPIAIRRSA